MDNNKVLNALSYLSIFFAPFIVPIIVYFVSKESNVKHHAMRALISHLIPIGLGFVLFLIVIASTALSSAANADTFIAFLPITFIVYGIICVALTIWNIIQAVKVLRD